MSAMPIAAGFILLLVGLMTGPRGAVVVASENLAAAATELAPTSSDTLPARTLYLSYVVAAVAGILFFVMSVSLLGVWPKQVLAQQTLAMESSPI